MQSFKNIKAWQRAKTLAVEVYKLTESFPSDQRHGGLTSQIQRAVVSIGANITEGSARKGSQDFARFLNIAEASAAELQFLLILSKELAFGDSGRIDPLIQEADEIGRMINVFRQKVEQGKNLAEEERS
jgi:four helix bundle protein